MSHRYHLPPSAHTTWVGNRFVICTFVPRPFETDPGALKVPFFHNNDDYDEVIFYHAGDFFSRDNIKPGVIELAPLRLHPWAAPEGAAAHVRGGEAGDRRICRDAGCPRCAGCRAGDGGGRDAGLCGKLDDPRAGEGAEALHEARDPSRRLTGWPAARRLADLTAASPSCRSRPCNRP